MTSSDPRGAAPDLIIIGSGIAGLYAALLAAPHCRVLLVTKGRLEESNTRYAQGGIAVAMRPGDSPQLHRRDTIAAGDGLCDEEAVAILTAEAPAAIRHLLDLGVPFDREAGELAWTLEAAHSMPRVLHAGGDATGHSIETVLANAVRRTRVTILEHALVAELLLDNDTVSGVRLLHRGEERLIATRTVLLASGGAGQLFARTTNPAVATGDGLALAYRAGAELVDLEMIQFHPTAVVLPGAPSFLISEAVRGEGAILRDGAGRAFMAAYHPDRELAPRDVVARAIHSVMARSGATSVGLDLTALLPETVERRFPGIVRFCREHGIEPLRRPIPVAPAAHYLMGGVRTDTWGRTAVPGLLAVGEVASTGVHGANRLASNSLLEGLVFSRRAVHALSRGDAIREEGPDPEWIASAPEAVPCVPADRGALAAIMWRHAGVVRSADSLAAAERDVAALLQQRMPCTESEWEAANLASLAQLVLRAATVREESRGGHFRSDFPRKSDGSPVHTVVAHGRIGLLPLAAGRLVNV